MKDRALDRVTRALSASPGRRDVLRALAGIALSGATSLVSAVPSHAADENPPLLGPYGGDVSVEKSNKKKRKEKHCKKQAQQCNVDVAGWCGTFWLDYDSCVASLGSCCSFVRNCKYGSADSCIANNPYYFLA